MSFRAPHGRGGGGGGGMQKPRGGGGPGGMNFPNEMQPGQQGPQPFGFPQRQYPPPMMPPHLQQQSQQQPPPPQPSMPPQPIQIPPLPTGSRSFMSGMPSPSLTQPNMMGYQGPGTSSGNMTRAPFGPPIGPIEPGQKSHHDILRRHQEEYAMKQLMQMAVSHAHSNTPGTYVGMSSKHNNLIIPVLPRLTNPNQVKE